MEITLSLAQGIKLSNFGRSVQDLTQGPTMDIKNGSEM